MILTVEGTTTNIGIRQEWYKKGLDWEIIVVGVDLSGHQIRKENGIEKNATSKFLSLS